MPNQGRTEMREIIERAVLIFVIVMATGCASMSPEQLKASAGMTTCTKPFSIIL